MVVFLEVGISSITLMTTAGAELCQAQCKLWFGLVYEEDLKRPLVPLKEAKATLERYLETIPGRFGSGRVGSVQ